jgi:2-succinyl-6-hydroxy-2,4-cyclohexadiene-1-carboxylate synthase
MSRALHSDVRGRGARLVLVHGFTQTRRSWDGTVRDLVSDHEVVTVDAPGHGDSARVAGDLRESGRLVGEAGGAATYVGYSMGGRICLHTALAMPQQVRGLVLVSATGGIDDAGERAARCAEDEARAARLEEIGVDAFVDEWLAQPMFSGLDDAARAVADRRTNTAGGLASSLRLAGTGRQSPLWDDLHRLDMPVLVLAGERDEKFRLAGERLTTAIGPNATYEVVAGAGHTLHLEQPGAFLATLRGWLARHRL